MRRWLAKIVEWSLKPSRCYVASTFLAVFLLASLFEYHFRIADGRLHHDMVDNIQTNQPLQIMSAIFFAGLTGFLYFLNQWIFQRFQSHTVHAEKAATVGNPVLIALINVVGSCSTCLAGIHYCIGAFLMTTPNESLGLRHLLLFALEVPVFCLWLGMFMSIFWLLRNWGHFKPDMMGERRSRESKKLGLPDMELKGLPDCRIFMLLAFIACTLFNIVAFNQSPPFASAVLCMAYIFSAIGIGVYAAFQLDYLPRAISLMTPSSTRDEKVSGTQQGGNAQQADAADRNMPGELP
ncbi:MAG: hypothetical protein H0T47_02485 [Planctomycetaceae bacterium]|nr:hypothetical protein [Planctomycetaceae bacterium]